MCSDDTKVQEGGQSAFLGLRRNSLFAGCFHPAFLSTLERLIREMRQREARRLLWQRRCC